MYDNFVVEGDKIASEIIRFQPEIIEELFAIPDWIAQQGVLPESLKERIFSVSEKDLSRISGLKTPNQVFVVCSINNVQIDTAAINNSLTLYLEEIQNPGNMGAILRVADWFGIEQVCCSPNCVEIYNPKVLQASMGAFLRVKTPVISLQKLKEKCPEVPILAAVLEGENVFQQSFEKKAILLIGNEGSGLTPQSIALATHQISIPRSKQGGAESLNAAVATGILCAALLGNP